MSKTSNSQGETPFVMEAPVNRFYRTVWRWHFYAGMFVIPFMLVLATTGIIYLFKPQLDGLMYHHQMFVQPTGTMLSYTQQLDVAKNAYPEAVISKFTPSITPNRSAEVSLTTSEPRNLLVFVNPYTGKVLGARDEDRNLQAYARKVHGELMIGKVGDTLVELAACWGLVLLITGLYLWFPREKFSIFGTLIPRLWSKSQRIFWRDLHAVPGFYSALLIGFLILTGLPWSGFWGGTFAQVWNHFPAQMEAQIPKSTLLTGTLNQNGEQVVPWAVEKLPMPLSSTSTNKPHHGVSSAEANVTSEGFSARFGENLDSVITLAQSKGVLPGFNVSFPKDKTGVYTVSASPNDPRQEVTLHIDQYSSEVLADVRWQNYSLVPKLVEMGIAIHMGKFFGLGNQLLMLFACLSVIVLCVSGVVMWWRRRPSGRIGAPTLPTYVSYWNVPMVIVAVSGIVLPLVGLSLVIMLLLDYLVLSRIPLLKQILN